MSYFERVYIPPTVCRAGTRYLGQCTLGKNSMRLVESCEEGFIEIGGNLD